MVYSLSGPDDRIVGSNKEIFLYNSVLEGGQTFALMNNLDKISIYNAKSMIDFSSPRKGRLEAVMTGYVYSKLSKLGIKTNLVGMIEKRYNRGVIEEICIPYHQSSSPTSKIVTRWMNKPRLGKIGSLYDYSEVAYTAKQVISGSAENVILPFEVIWRDYIIVGVSSCTLSPQRWSIFIAENDYNRIQTYEQISSMQTGTLIKLPRPCVEITTKYELGYKAVQSHQYALKMEIENEDTPYSYANIVEFALRIGHSIRVMFSKIGIVIPDLKMEIGLECEGELVLLDVMGPDEARMFLEHKPTFDFSKQLIANLFKEYTNWITLLQKVQAKYGDEWSRVFADLDLKQPKMNVLVVSALGTLNQSLTDVLLGIKTTDTLNESVNNLSNTIATVGESGMMFSDDVDEDYCSQIVKKLELDPK